jgi:hypothetical protein
LELAKEDKSIRYMISQPHKTYNLLHCSRIPIRILINNRH